MRRQFLLRGSLLLILVVVVVWWVSERSYRAPSREELPPIARPAPMTPSDPEGGFTVTSSRPGPAPGEEASADVLAQARARLGGDARGGRCGEYPLLGNVAEPALLGSCQRIGAALDDVYHERFGVLPLGEPAATILLFGEGEDYRAFAAGQGMSGTGYAGYSSPQWGYTVLWADASRPEDFARTLAHELTHLVNRRALGGNLPRWLSEGLADAIGDTATVDGIGPLEGLQGVEGEAERLRLAFAEGGVRSLETLVAAADDEFDVGSPSYDYELSALTVRYLLLDPTLSAGFRDFLDELAEGESYDPERLRRHLGVEWSELDRRLRSWLAEQGD